MILLVYILYFIGLFTFYFECPYWEMIFLQDQIDTNNYLRVFFIFRSIYYAMIYTFFNQYGYFF